MRDPGQDLDRDKAVARHEAGHVIVPYVRLKKLPVYVTIERVGELEGHCEWGDVMPRLGALKQATTDELHAWLAMRAAGEQALEGTEFAELYRGGLQDRKQASGLLEVLMNRAGQPFHFSQAQDFAVAAAPYWAQAEADAKTSLFSARGLVLLDILTNALLANRTMGSADLASTLASSEIP